MPCSRINCTNSQNTSEGYLQIVWCFEICGGVLGSDINKLQWHGSSRHDFAYKCIYHYPSGSTTWYAPILVSGELRNSILLSKHPFLADRSVELLGEAEMARRAWKVLQTAIQHIVTTIQVESYSFGILNAVPLRREKSGHFTQPRQSLVFSRCQSPHNRPPYPKENPNAKNTFMSAQLCGSRMLDFNSSQEEQIGIRPPYILWAVSLDDLPNSRDVHERLRAQSRNWELPAEDVWRSYQTVYTGTSKGVRYKMTIGSPIESKLVGHIPITVIAWRELGTASGIEVIGCADTSVMPANHPDIFKFSSLAPPPPLSPSSSASSSRCSSLTHRLFTFQGTTTLPKSLCQMPTSIHNVRPSNILFRIWNQLTQIRPCILIGLLFFAFLSLSIFLGVFFTLDKSYGYSMGDAFTLAGFVFGIDACCTPVLFAYHYPHCECRRRGRVKLCTE